MSTVGKLIAELQEQRILVTGGAGFIGSHLVDLLLQHGKQVNVLDNLSRGRLANLDAARKSPNFTFFKGDLLNPQDIMKAIKGCELVFHLAANPDVKSGAVKPDSHLQQNVIATFRLLEAIRQSGSTNGLVFTSSSTVYGDATVLPTPEDYAPLKPISIYGATKLAGEAIISSHAYTYGFRAVICRLANIIGSRSQRGVIYDFIRKLQKTPKTLEILGDGTQRKSYLYVDDCVECFILSFLRSQEQVEIFNVGSADWISVMEIAKSVVDAMGLTGVRFHCTGGVDGGRGWEGDVKQMLPDISRIRELGWHPRWTSAKAVRAAADAILQDAATASP